MDPAEHDSDTDGMSDSPYDIFGQYRPQLKPVHVEVPNEILTMIAENCVEPYDVSTSKHFPLSTTENCMPHLVSIALTSRAFAIGIKTGMRKRFCGKLTMYDFRSARRLPAIIRRHNLHWLAQSVTEIMVYADHEMPFGRINYNLYPNTKTLRLEFYHTDEDGDEFGYPLYTIDPGEFDAFAMTNVLSVKELILRDGRGALLMDKLVEDVKLIVLQSYVWTYGMRRERMQNIIDISGDEPVVISKDRYHDSIC